MEALATAKQATQADKFVANLIECRIDLPRMKIGGVCLIHVSLLFRSDTQAEPGNDIQWIDRDCLLKVGDRLISLPEFKKRFPEHAMSGE